MTNEIIAEERLRIIRILLDALEELDPDPNSVKKRLKRLARKYEVADIIESANLDDITKDILNRKFVQKQDCATIADWVGYSERTVRTKIDDAMPVLAGLI
jgi:hypothetical protein